MKKISWLLIIVFFLSVVMPGINLMGNLVVAADTLRVAKITVVQGDVKVLRAGGEKYFPAFKGMGLTQGDTIVTGKDGRATLELAEDKELKIGENSRVMISELVQSPEKNADKTSLNLKAGQVYTNVKSKLSPDAKYEIRTPTAVMGVRGTQFFVSLASGGQAKVVTLEGNVIVTVPQLVTLEDGTTVTQDVEIKVQPNQILVQTGDAADPGRYDLETLTEDRELSLFVLETLQEISIQQPDLINPEILENLKEKIEKAREEQQRQQEGQQEELEQNIQYGNDTMSEGTSATDPRNGKDDRDNDDKYEPGNGEDDRDDDDEDEPGNGEDDEDDDNEDLPEIVITTQLNVVYLLSGSEVPRTYNFETVPAGNVELEAEVENDSIAEASFDGNTLFIYGLEPGITTVTVTARREGYIPAVKSFKVTVTAAYEDGDWYKTIIDRYGEHTDIALDSKGMPHIIYEDGSVMYKHWNGSSWQEEEPQIGSSQGSLAIAEIYGNDYSFISYNFGGSFGYDVFNGEYWKHQGFGNEEVTVGASCIDTVLYNDEYATGVSYYDEENGDLYFRFNAEPTGSIYSWGEPFLVDGENSDAGKSSSLAFGEDGLAYIAYYDYSSDMESGLLKLAVIDELLDPELLDIMVVDDQVGYSEGQYVSVSQAVYNGSTAMHLAYYDAVNKNLKYAAWLGEEWFIETVDGSEGDVGKYASLALDDEGNPHISYYAESDSGGALKYARRDPDHEGEWLIEIIDKGEGVGLYSSIAFDNNLSIPHFAYTAMIDGDRVVKHATRKGVMNTIEPDVLSGTEQAFEDASFYINSFGNDFWYAREELGEYLDASDYIVSEDDDVLTITLKSDYLNRLEPNAHRIWFYFKYGCPVLLTIDVEADLEAYTERCNQDLAYDPINNRYLMVYEKQIVEMTNPEIWGRFISAEGVLGKEFKISSEERCYDPKVVYNPDNSDFLVTWWQENYPTMVYAQIIDTEWESNSELENFAVCPYETEEGGRQYYPTVAINTTADEYLIAWMEDTDKKIYGQRLAFNGEQIEDRLNLTNDMVGLHNNSILAFADNQYLLVFEDANGTNDSDIKGRIFNSAGAFVKNIEIATDEYYQWAPTIVMSSEDGLILVVWSEYDEENNCVTYGRFVNADGNVGDEFIVCQSSSDQYSPSLASNNTNGFYLLAWESGLSVYAQQFTGEGIAGDPVEIHSQDAWYRNIKVVYNPEEDNYLAAYERRGNGRTIIDVTIIDVDDPFNEDSVQPDLEDIIVTNNVTGTDIVRVDNVPPGATVNVYDSYSASIPLGYEIMPETTEATYVDIYFEEGLLLDNDSIWVTITEVGKLESERTEKAIPTPLMRESYDFEIDTVEYGYGKVTFVLTFEQIEDMELATGKSISKIWGFVGVMESSFYELPDLDDTSIDKVEITSPDSEIYIGSIDKEEGNYPYAIAVYDDSDNVIACYIHYGWITVYGEV